MRIAKHRNSPDVVERSLASALSKIDQMASQLELPKNVKEEASILYRRAVEEHLIKGWSIQSVASASLYIACRELEIPRTLKEMVEVSQVDKRKIIRCYRSLARELGIHLPPIDPSSYVARFGSELDVSEETRTKAIELLKKAKEKRLTSGHCPQGLAAGAIYLAGWLCREHRIQEDVADVAHVTEVTVRNRYRELVDELDLDVELP